MKRFSVIVIALILTVAMIGACSRSKPKLSAEDKEIEIAKERISEFWKSLKITQDEIYKAAIMKEDSEPDKARDYFNAHTNLRNMIHDPDAKVVILAAILGNEPTAFRPMSFEVNPDQIDVTVAMGPTDEKTGILSMRKKEKKWAIYDFDGTWQEEKKKKAQDDPNAMPYGD